MKVTDLWFIDFRMFYLPVAYLQTKASDTVKQTVVLPVVLGVKYLVHHNYGEFKEKSAEGNILTSKEALTGSWGKYVTKSFIMGIFYLMMVK
jgi:hypothetical protein